jgi:hypothetical protein
VRGEGQARAWVRTDMGHADAVGVVQQPIAVVLVLAAAHWDHPDQNPEQRTERGEDGDAYQKTHHSFLSCPYVCPEPVLAK